MQEINIDNLADYIFLKNNNTIIALSLPELQCQKDLFYFLLDLFCKGLVLLFGDNNRVEIEKLTYHDFDRVKNKLKYCGIVAKLEVIPGNELEMSLLSGNPINVSTIEQLPDNLDVKDYKFKLLTRNSLYSVFFELEIPTDNRF